jgi:16S rRNA (guanine527-N7)-methyltransferase
VPADIAARLAERAHREQIALPGSLSAKLVAYFELLQHWNKKINLTAISDPDEAVDRLLLEPVVAAVRLPKAPRLADLGSGGGSPAIPLALALNASQLLMVESRSRKAAFLREALREIGLSGTVESARFEDVSRLPLYASLFDVVSMRAVRADSAALDAAAHFLRSKGVVALFRGPDGPDRVDALPVLAWRETVPLLPSTRSRLTTLFHVEQSPN